MKSANHNTAPSGSPAQVKDVGILIRVSTINQVEADSPAIHEHRARQYAEMKGWNVVQVYRLDAVSGKSTIAHPEAIRMLADIREGRITGLIISKLARLGRNTKELLEYADIFRNCGADLISLAESIDTSTPAGRLFYTMIAGMAQWEREEIGARIKAAVLTRARMGKPTNGKAPVGYHWVDQKLVPKPDELEVRVRILELYVRHRRIQKVVRELKKEGFRMRSGKPYSFVVVKLLIEDRTVIGLHRAAYTHLVNGKRIVKPETEWVITEVEPIVDKDLWQLCNDILKANTQSRGPGRQSNYLFGHLTVCFCGQKMYATSGSATCFTCSKCQNKVSRAGLEESFLRELHTAFASPLNVQALVHAAGESIQQSAARLEVLRREIDGITKKTDNLIALYGEGHLTAEAFGLRNKPLEKLQQDLEEQVRQLKSDIAPSATKMPTVESIVEDAQQLRAQWPGFSLEQKQAIVESLVTKIEVLKDTIAFHFTETPSLQLMTTKLCKLIAAQPCCQMIITCAKPSNPPKPKAPSKRILLPHAGLIESKIRAGLGAKQIHEQLRAETGFVVSYPTVSKYVCEVRKALFPDNGAIYKKPNQCDPHRVIIEAEIKKGNFAKYIYEQLKAKASYSGSFQSVQRYVRILKARVVAEGHIIPERGNCVVHRKFIEARTKAGVTPMRILKELKSQFQFAGAYMEVYRAVADIKKQALNAGQTIITGRSVCFEFADLIHSKVRSGMSARLIWEALQEEVQFIGSYEDVYRYVWQFKRRITQDGEQLPGPTNSCAMHKVRILAMLANGKEANEIFEELKSEVGFTGMYKAVRRYIHDLERNPSVSKAKTHINCV
jgi:site-specific DNA recombinase